MAAPTGADNPQFRPGMGFNLTERFGRHVALRLLDKNNLVLELVLPVNPEAIDETIPHKQTMTPAQGGVFQIVGGRGLSRIAISGTTGLRGNLMSATGNTEQLDGFQLYLRLKKMITDYMTQKYERPDDLELLFINDIDGYVASVTPDELQIKENRSRPMLIFYTVPFSVISYLDEKGASGMLSEKQGPTTFKLQYDKEIANAAASLEAAEGQLNDVELSEEDKTAVAQALHESRVAAAQAANPLNKVRSAVNAVSSTISEMESGVQDFIEESWVLTELQRLIDGSLRIDATLNGILVSGDLGIKSQAYLADLLNANFGLRMGIIGTLSDLKTSFTSSGGVSVGVHLP